MTLQPPKHFNRSAVLEYLDKCAFIFSLSGKKQRGFTLDLSKIVEVGLLGQLLIYKFVSFTARKSCFELPNLAWHPDERIQKEFASSGFLSIMMAYVNNPGNWDKIVHSYRKLKSTTDEHYFFTPHSLLRSEIDSRNVVEQEFLDGISEFYGESKAVSVVSLCISELMMNFWAHATDDSDTVLVARGGKKHFELLLADNAQGTITTLRESRPDLSSSPGPIVLETACRRGVSSKLGSFHQGYGLFLVSQLAQVGEGWFTIYSEGSYVKFQNGKIKKGTCGFWKGTIIDLRIDLHKPRTVTDLGLNRIDQRINWGTR